MYIQNENEYLNLNDVKWAFTTRRVPNADIAKLSHDVASAISGDLLVARIAEVGHHQKVQLRTGRQSLSYQGGVIGVVCGARYAPDQFEGLAEIQPHGADLLAAGGVAGTMRQQHERMIPPIRLLPLGLALDAEGEVINIARYALRGTDAHPRIPAIVVVGGSMNAGKTTAAASLAHGLRRGGWQVAALKVTGTGAFGDYHAYLDAGAHVVADFTDAGMASTY